MLDALKFIVDTVKALINLVIMIVTSLFQAISMLPSLITSLVESVGYLPAILAAFATLTITFMVVNYMIGRK